MALERLYINGGGARKGEEVSGEKTKNPVQIFRHRLFEESGERHVESDLSSYDVIIRVTIDRCEKEKFDGKSGIRWTLITS